MLFFFLRPGGEGCISAVYGSGLEHKYRIHSKSSKGLSLFIIIFKSLCLYFHCPLTCMILSTPSVNIAPPVLEAIDHMLITYT